LANLTPKAVNILRISHYIDPVLIAFSTLGSYPEREYGLVVPVPALFGGSAGRVTLNQEQFAFIGVPFQNNRIIYRAFRRGQDGFTLHQFPGFSGRALACAARITLLMMLRASLDFLPGMLPVPETGCIHNTNNFRVPSFVLVCPSNCGSGTFTDMMALRPS